MNDTRLKVDTNSEGIHHHIVSMVQCALSEIQKQLKFRDLDRNESLDF